MKNDEEEVDGMRRGFWGWVISGVFGWCEIGCRSCCWCWEDPMILDTSERASEQIEGTSGDMYREKCCS